MDINKNSFHLDCRDRLKNTICIFLFFLFKTHLLNAQIRGEVLNASKSGKTFMLNLGEIDGLETGDIFKVRLLTENNPKKKQLLEARAVLVYPNRSYFSMVSEGEPDERDEGGKDVSLIYQGLKVQIFSYKKFQQALAAPHIVGRQNIFHQGRTELDLADVDYIGLKEHYVNNALSRKGDIQSSRLQKDHENRYEKVDSKDFVGIFNQGKKDFTDGKGNNFNEYFINVLERQNLADQYVDEFNRDRFDQFIDAYLSEEEKG